MDRPESTSPNHEFLTRSKRKAAHDANPKTKIPRNIQSGLSTVSVKSMSPGTLRGLLREYNIFVPKGAKVAELREEYRKSVLPKQREADLATATTSPSDTHNPRQSTSAHDDNFPDTSPSLPALKITRKPLDYIHATNQPIQGFLADKGVATGSQPLEAPVPESLVDKPSGFHECTIPVLQRHLRVHGFTYSGLRKAALVDRCKSENLPLPDCKTIKKQSSNPPNLKTADPLNSQLNSDTPPHPPQGAAEFNCRVPLDMCQARSDPGHLSTKKPLVPQALKTLDETTDCSEENKNRTLTLNPKSPGTESSLEYIPGSSTVGTDDDGVSGTDNSFNGKGSPTPGEESENPHSIIKKHKADEAASNPGAIDCDGRNEPPKITNTNIQQKDHARLLSPVPQPRMSPEPPGINAFAHGKTESDAPAGENTLECDSLSEPHHSKNDSHNACQNYASTSYHAKLHISPLPPSCSQETKGKSREEPLTSPTLSSKPTNQPSSASHSQNNTTNDKLDFMMTFLEKLTLSHDLVQHNTILTNQSIQDLEGTLGDVQLEQMATTEKLDSLFTTLSNFLESNEERHGSSTSGRRVNGAPRHRYKSQGGAISAAIRLCCMSLIGRRPEDDTFPEAANDAEKRQWMHNLLQNPADGPIVRVIGDAPDRTDPQFPFKSGPGHLKATTTQLQIMRTMLLQHGVRRFRPDFKKSYKSNDNSFLWGLAIKIFLRLVAAGEYPGVNVESAPRELVEAEFQLHVTDCLKRKDRQERSLTPAQLAAQRARTNMASRLFSLRDLRQTIAADTPGLEALSVFVAECCSDDELQGGDNVEDHVVGSSRPKTCQVLDLEWRSEECENVVIALDSLREDHRRMSPATPRGVQYRVRLRPPRSERKKSSMEAPEGLTIDCYRPSFLRSKTEAQKAILKVNMVPGLHRFKDILL